MTEVEVTYMHDLTVNKQAIFLVHGLLGEFSSLHHVMRCACYQQVLSFYLMMCLIVWFLY